LVDVPPDEATDSSNDTASEPSPQNGAAYPDLMDGTANVYLERAPRRRRRVEAGLHVILDGKRVAKIRPDSKIRITVAAGPHRIRLGQGLIGGYINGTRLRFSVNAGDDLVLLCGVDRFGFAWLEVADRV
jgi:hypothetical protein